MKEEIMLYDSWWFIEDEEKDEDADDYNWYDFKENLEFACKQHYESGFVCISSIRTWRGRYTGYYDISINDNLYDIVMKIVSSGYDYIKIYINKNNDLELALSHHDGTNYVVIRQLKEKYHDENYLDKIETDLYNQDDTSAYKYTKAVKYILKEAFGL